jgi:hypothetical protein
MLIWPSNSNNEYLISRSGCRDYLSRNAAAGIPAALGVYGYDFECSTLNRRLMHNLNSMAGIQTCECCALWLQPTIVVVQYRLYVGTDFDDSWNKQLVDRYFSRRHSFRRLKRLPFSHFLFLVVLFVSFPRLVGRCRKRMPRDASQPKCRSHCLSSVIFNDRYVIHSLSKSHNSSDSR